MAVAPAERGVRLDRRETNFRNSLLLESTALQEYFMLRFHPVYFGTGVPRGDNHPVMTVPGFLGSDVHLEEMRNWLKRVNYDSLRSGILFNADFKPFNINPRTNVLEMKRRLEQKVKDTGKRATLIGWSLGGIFSLGLAIARPDLIKKVITMGTPLNRDIREAAHPFVRTIGQAFTQIDDSTDKLLRSIPYAPIPESVDLISIYSMDDGVVDWRSCIDPRAKVNIEVQGPHMAFAWNPNIYKNVGKILAGQGFARAF